jgi:crotonobetainyl-CoA:carnitine CoA-transferase CaiB-like acyl-CoA transferase
MAAIHQFTVNRFVYSGRVEKRVGNRYMWAHPITLYRTKDGYVSISASTDDQTERLLQLMGRADLLEDPRFSTGFNRLQHAEAFDALVGPWFTERTTAEIVRECQEWRVPTAFVHDVASILKDEQYAARGYFVTLDHPETGPRPYAGPPFRLSLTPAELSRAPLLGEHNDEVFLGRLRLSRQDLDGLKVRGVV